MSRILHPAYKHERAIAPANHNDGQIFLQPPDAPCRCPNAISAKHNNKQSIQRAGRGFSCQNQDRARVKALKSLSILSLPSFTLVDPSSSHSTHTLFLSFGPRSQSSELDQSYHILFRAQAFSFSHRLLAISSQPLSPEK